MLGKVIKKEFVKLMPKTTVKEALAMLTEKKVNGAPVLDENGKLVGIVVKADLYRFLIEEGHYDTCPTEWVMTKKVITASEDEDIISIGKKLRENNIIAIPIVDSKNIVIGMVTLESILDSVLLENSKN